MPISTKTNESVQVAARAASDKLAKDMVALDLTEQSVLSEVFLIATGANTPQVEAIADNVEEKMRAIGEKPLRRETSDEWILLDYSDLVVHIQSENVRKYYMLDRLWNDCPRITLDVVEEEAAHV